MQLNGNAITLELRPCTSCNGSGRAAKQVTCPACKGTGNGPKGGHNGCKKCSGLRYVYSRTETVTCGSCDGAGHVPENDCDTMPDAWWQALTFKVYRHERAISFNEYLLGLGCVFSCTDYGRAYESTDEKVIADVRAHTWIQLCKVAKDLTMCDHVGIFIAHNGYSVRAVYTPDAHDAIATIANERGKDEGFRVGGILAGEGLNGTMGAVYKQ